MGQPYDGLQAALAPVMRQLERIDAQTREELKDLRMDVKDLRREVVGKEVQKSEMDAMRSEIVRLKEDRQQDKKEASEALLALEKKQLSARELLALRLAGVGAVFLVIIGVIDILIRFRP